MLAIVIAKSIGMLRDVVLANYYGTSAVSDAYLIAVSVPTLLFYFVGHALSTAYIPMYKKVLCERGERAAHKFSDTLMTAALLGCLLIVLVLLLFPGFVVNVFAGGFDGEAKALTVSFIRTSACSVLFMAMVSICGGFLRTQSNFIVPALVSLPRNVVIVASIIISALFGVKWLGVGLLLAYLVEFLFLFPFVLRCGYHPMLRFSFRDSAMKETGYIILPIILGVCVSQVNKIVDKAVASTVSTGAVSALGYAAIINNAIQEILVTGIITILFVDCATYVAEGRTEKVRQVTVKTIDFMLFLLVPGVCGILLLAEPIVACFLMRGSFDGYSLSLTSGALRAYSVGLVFLAVRDMLIKVFYAYKDTKTTMATSVIAILLNIGLNFSLVNWLGVGGLALATSISAIFHCLALYALLSKKIGGLMLKTTCFSLLMVALASSIMSISVYILYNFILPEAWGMLLRLLLSVLAGVIVYAMAALAFRLPQAVAIGQKIFRKIKGA